MIAPDSLGDARNAAWQAPEQDPCRVQAVLRILRERFFAANLSNRLKYATVGVLFVNISIGGVLTSFAAPPVLMVAAKWGWDSAFMMETFGWRAAAAVTINAAIVTWMYRRELAAMEVKPEPARLGLPKPVLLMHAGLLVAVVMFSHHPALFLGLLLLFLGIATAYPQYQDRIILREGLLVAFFLAGLVILGGLQQWWLKPLLLAMGPDSAFFGTTALTAITDNAAYEILQEKLQGWIDKAKTIHLPPGRIFTLPTVYGGEYGPDLERASEIRRVFPQPKSFGFFRRRNSWFILSVSFAAWPIWAVCRKSCACPASTPREPLSPGGRWAWRGDRRTRFPRISLQDSITSDAPSFPSTNPGSFRRFPYPRGMRSALNPFPRKRP